MRNKIMVALVVPVLMGFTLCSPAVAEGSYTVTVVQGLQNSGRRALDNSAEIVGQIYTQTGDYNAYCWKDGTLTALGHLPGDGFSGAYSINTHGQIVGESYGYTNMTDQPVLWNHGVIQPLGLLDGYLYGAADAINDLGQAAGGCTNDFYFSTTEATLWKDGKIEDLEPLAGDPGSFATALNNWGVVIGLSQSTRTRGVFWIGHKAIELAGLGGGDTEPNSINDWGHIVGRSLSADGNQYATFWDFWKKGKLSLLPGLPGATFSNAENINQEDVIVGYSGPDAADEHAVVWKQGRVFDLNALIPAGSGWVLQQAVTINGHDQIFGFGLLNGVPSAFLLTPDKS